MPSFTAKDVQRLRQVSGAGMMDAKNALTETDGLFDDALRLLQEKGLASTAKRADRENNQGAVALGSADGGKAVALVELKSETDFVAKSPDFTKLAQELADAVAADGEEATESSRSQLDELKVTLKENIELGRVVRFEASNGTLLDTYLHIQADRGVNGVLSSWPGATRSWLTTWPSTSPSPARPSSRATSSTPPTWTSSGRCSRPRPATRASPSRPGRRSSRAS